MTLPTVQTRLHEGGRDSYRRRGTRGRRNRPSHGWAALTPTELEVVRLVGRGMTNPGIAKKLFMSRNTVKCHLVHVFTKLAVTTCAELAGESSQARAPRRRSPSVVTPFPPRPASRVVRRAPNNERLGKTMNVGTPLLRMVAVCSAAVVVTSIAIASLWPQYPSWMWYVLVPVGILGAGATAVVSTGELVRRRFAATR